VLYFGNHHSLKPIEPRSAHHLRQRVDRNNYRNRNIPVLITWNAGLPRAQPANKYEHTQRGMCDRCNNSLERHKQDLFVNPGSGNKPKSMLRERFGTSGKRISPRRVHTQ
jgi:hypothetical protein